MLRFSCTNTALSSKRKKGFCPLNLTFAYRPSIIKIINYEHTENEIYLTVLH